MSKQLSKLIDEVEVINLMREDIIKYRIRNEISSGQLEEFKNPMIKKDMYQYLISCMHLLIIKDMIEV